MAFKEHSKISKHLEIFKKKLVEVNRFKADIKWLGNFHFCLQKLISNDTKGRKRGVMFFVLNSICFIANYKESLRCLNQE